MSDDQFTKLFKYIEEFLEETRTKLEETASQDSVDRLINTIDSFIGRLDSEEIENKVRDRQFERSLAWARKMSEKTGIPLKNL